MSQRLFLYGTLCDPELYRIVSGTAFAPVEATLAGAEVRWAAGEAFPILVDAPDRMASGVVVSVDQAAKARLDFYEVGFGYDLQECDVLLADGPARAWVYVPQTDWAPGAPWSLTDWQRDHGALSRLAAQDYMRLTDTHAPPDAARAFAMIRSRAASRLRAMADPSPAIEPAMRVGEAAVTQTRQPYVDYFAVREDWIAFPRFGGGLSDTVKRASFMGGDAVTVLPYDARTDTVLLIRQFRHGPFVRGDSNPWTLEPAAGRIDPGENPEETACRELAEETGVNATALHFIGRYYPSPGAYSEYLYSYVAMADLSGYDRRVGGLEDEAEDIMAHVLTFDDAMSLIPAGAVNTGPLILSLGWLAMNRERLRG